MTDDRKAGERREEVPVGVDGEAPQSSVPAEQSDNFSAKGGALVLVTLCLGLLLGAGGTLLTTDLRWSAVTEESQRTQEELDEEVRRLKDRAGTIEDEKDKLIESQKQIAAEIAEYHRMKAVLEITQLQVEELKKLIDLKDARLRQLEGNSK